MAELAIATGIIQVAGAGVALTKALYNFGATTSSAGEQTDFIGKNITLYCRVLKTLGQQLKVKEPDHTEEALDVAYEIHEQSNSLFQKIWKLLPTAEGDGVGLSLKQRILWNFRRSRVDYLVGQLESLKSTVSLLLHILASVPKIRKYRRSKKKSRHDREEIGSRLNEVQNLIYERCQTQRNLSVLAEKAKRDSFSVLAPACQHDLSVVQKIEGSQELTKSAGPTLAQIDAYAAGLTGENSRAMVLEKTASWIAHLYGQWTTLSEDRDKPGQPSFDGTAVADLTADTSPLGSFQKTSHTGGQDLPEHTDANSRTEAHESWIQEGVVSLESHIHPENPQCSCIRAKVHVPGFRDEMEIIDSDLNAAIALSHSSKGSSERGDLISKLSRRRHQLDKEYLAKIDLPLFKGYQTRISELLLAADREIQALCQQRLQAIDQQNWEECDIIKQTRLPPLLVQRQVLRRCLRGHSYVTRWEEGGAFTMSPKTCEAIKDTYDEPSSEDDYHDQAFRPSHDTSTEQKERLRRFHDATDPLDTDSPNRRPPLGVILKRASQRMATPHRQSRPSSGASHLDNPSSPNIAHRPDYNKSKEEKKTEKNISKGVDPDPFGQSKFWTPGGTLNDFGYHPNDLKGRAGGYYDRHDKYHPGRE